MLIASAELGRNTIGCAGKRQLARFTSRKTWLSASEPQAVIQVCGLAEDSGFEPDDLIACLRAAGLKAARQSILRCPIVVICHNLCYKAASSKFIKY